MSCQSVVKCKLRRVRENFRYFYTKGDNLLEEEKIITKETGTADYAETSSDDAKPAEEKLYTQAELDELLKAERENAEKKLAEAKKLSEMSESDRAAYSRKLIDKELAEREAAVAKRELTADALDMLAEAGLPKQLAACLNYANRDECEASIEVVRTAFEGAVSAAVNERIRGRIPKFSPASTSDAFLDGLGM